MYKEEHISQRAIGEMFGMSQTAIGHIIQGKTYKHVQ
jgi:predicted transcriptional regulator